MMRCAVFDLDGTLVDTSFNMIGAANTTFGRAVLNPDSHKGIAFAGARAMLREGTRQIGRPWSEAEIDAAYPDFLRHYEANLSTGSRPYDNARSVIEALRTSNWRVAICTNKPVHLARKLLADLEWLAPFSALIGADSLPVRKPDPAPVLEAIRLSYGDVAKLVMIGDTQGDLVAARCAGIPSVLANFGAVPYLDITEKPGAICRNISEVPAVLEAMISDNSSGTL